MRKRNIPGAELSTFVHGDAVDRKAFIQKLGEAFHEIGFVGVINHGISPDLVNHFYEESHNFFNLSFEIKRKYELEGLAGQRGFTSFGTEKAKQSKVADLKEFFQIGQEEEPKDGYASQTMANVLVAEAPNFTATGMELYKAFEEAGAALLRAIALYLDLVENYFDQYIRGGNSIQRSIHYPPIVREPESAIRAEQHEDINLITLLVGASSGGLQLLTMDNE